MPRKKRKESESIHFPQGKCPYVTYYLECMLGANATIECLDPEKHKDCEVKGKFMKK